MVGAMVLLYQALWQRIRDFLKVTSLQTSFPARVRESTREKLSAILELL
jgi:hypothetical protein